MNKKYLPYFESLDEKYKQVYMSWDKETLIDHLVANIHNGEVLLERIDEAIEFIYENAYDSERQNCIDDLWGEIPKLLEILKGSDKDE